MNLNETKKIVDFMKENGITELEYAAKGTTIKLRLDHKALKNGKKSETMGNEEISAPVVNEIAETVEEYEEPGVREVTTYTAEATEELAEELESEVEKPSRAARAIVAVSGARKKAVSKVTELLKRRPAAPVGETPDVDEDDEVATELDVMEDHEKAAKKENPSLRLRNPLSRFLKSQKDGAAHAKAQLEDEEPDTEEEVEMTEAPAEEEKKGLFSRFRRKKEEPAEEETAQEEAAEEVTEETPVEETAAEAAEVVEEVAEEVTEEAAPAEDVTEEAAPAEEVTEEAAVEETVEAPAEEPETVEDAEDTEEAPAAEDMAEEAAEEEPSEEDKLFGIVG